MADAIVHSLADTQAVAEAETTPTSATVFAQIEAEEGTDEEEEEEEEDDDGPSTDTDEDSDSDSDSEDSDEDSEESSNSEDSSGNVHPKKSKKDKKKKKKSKAGKNTKGLPKTSKELKRVLKKVPYLREVIVGGELAKVAFNYAKERVSDSVKQDASSGWNVAIRGRFEAFKNYCTSAWTQQTYLEMAVGDYLDYLQLFDEKDKTKKPSLA